RSPRLRLRQRRHCAQRGEAEDEDRLMESSHVKISCARELGITPVRSKTVLPGPLRLLADQGVGLGGLLAADQAGARGVDLVEQFVATRELAPGHEVVAVPTRRTAMTFTCLARAESRRAIGPEVERLARQLLPRLALAGRQEGRNLLRRLHEQLLVRLLPLGRV